jgi:flagellar basal-body rod protein FlgF
MATGLYSALSGAIGQTHALDVTANNMANIGTTGFKGSRVVFKEMLAEADGIVNQSHRQVRLDDVKTDFSTGGIKVTNGALDVAITGEGFFEVETESGTRYTRAGAFKVDEQGNLAMLEGHRVMGDGGPIATPPDKALHLMENGQIMAGDLELGKLKVVEFSDKSKLVQAGHNLWKAPEGVEGETIENPMVIPGAIERSNVNAVKAMTEIIRISRSYEALLKAVETFRTADKRTVQDLGR